MERWDIGINAVAEIFKAWDKDPCRDPDQSRYALDVLVRFLGSSYGL